MKKQPKIYRCQECKNRYTPKQASTIPTPSGKLLYICPTDGTMLVDATHVPTQPHPGIRLWSMR